MAPFPKTVDELIKAGYVYIEHRPCTGRHCEAIIELYRTPGGKTMPLDVDDAGNVVSHWSTCKDAAQFRR